MPIILEDLLNGERYIKDVFKEKKISGDGKYTKLASQWMEQRFSIKKNLFTTSGTHALEMAAILTNIHPGDEVIMPSFTFVSTANAFVLRGAKIKFVDIRPDTLNIDENLLEAAITYKTKLICPVHYAGIGCEMDTIMEIARKHKLYVVEDAAQGMMSSYKGQALGTIGDMGCYSFHETKNYSMGEGGAIAIQNAEFLEKAEIIREKGTNRSQFFRGMVDKYSWCDIGSSYLPSEINVAFLYAQLEMADAINQKRIALWERYYKGLNHLKEKGLLDLPNVPDGCTQNGHIFYIRVKDIEERTKLMFYLKQQGINTVFHFVPLHSSPAGRIYGEFVGNDKYTTIESERLIRLPIYYRLKEKDVDYVIEKISSYFS